MTQFGLQVGDHQTDFPPGLYNQLGWDCFHTTNEPRKNRPQDIMAGIKKKRKKLGGDSAAKRARIEQQSADQEEIEVVSAHADAVCASRKNINQIRQLNSAAKHPRGPVALAAIQGLQRVWLQWIADGSFDFHAAAGSSKKNEGSAAGALTAWMRQQYIQYIQVLIAHRIDWADTLGAC